MTGQNTGDDDQQDRFHHTPEERLSLLERDVRSHARSLTMITKSVSELSDGFSDKQIDQLKDAVSAAFTGVGLRVDDPDHVEDARRDFMFVRSLRKGVNGAASKIGWAVIAAILGITFWLFNAGLTFWKGH